MIEVDCITFHADEGTVWTFDGFEVTRPHVAVRFGVDHRPAADLLAALEAEGDDLVALIEEWQIIDAFEVDR